MWSHLALRARMLFPNAGMPHNKIYIHLLQFRFKEQQTRVCVGHLYFLCGSWFPSDQTKQIHRTVALKEMKLCSSVAEGTIGICLRYLLSLHLVYLSWKISPPLTGEEHVIYSSLWKESLYCNKINKQQSKETASSMVFKVLSEFLNDQGISQRSAGFPSPESWHVLSDIQFHLQSAPTLPTMTTKKHNDSRDFTCI